jgi:hypothetical protein
MSNQKGRNRKVTIFFVTREGTVNSYDIGQRMCYNTPLEAGEFFYDIDFAFVPVKCNRCSALQIAYLEGTSSIDEAEAPSWEDNMGYHSSFSCGSCNTLLSVSVLSTWYNYGVNFLSLKLEKCEVVQIHGIEKIFEQQKNILDNFRTVLA